MILLNYIENQNKVILTPNAVLIPQGTEFTVTVEDGATKLDMLEGKVYVVPYDGSTPMLICSGNSISASDDKIEKTIFDTNSIDKWWEVSADQKSPTGGGCLITMRLFQIFIF